MRILVDYIRERAEAIISFCDQLTKKDESFFAYQKAGDLCNDYMDECHKIEKAMYEISERFGDMKITECARRFGQIEGQIVPED